MPEEIINKTDSYTIGTAGKNGAIKVYFNLSKITDEEAKTLVRRANGLYKFIQEE